MFGIFADFLSSVITILFPVFASYKALRSSDPSQLAPWLMYWVILSVILLAESWTVFIIGWFPFYSWIRLFFMCYLVLPQTQGARLLYQDYVDPFLAHHEHEIEEMIGRSHERAKALGLQYFYQAPSASPHNKLHPLPPAGPAGYAQSLLSRFNIPTAAAASTSTGDWYSALSSAFGAVSSAGRSPEAHEEGMSASSTLLQRQIQSMTGLDKARYISQQRELLDRLRSDLTNEESKIGRDEPENDDLAYGAPLRKNKSDNSFDVVDDEDLGSRATRRTSGKWTSGWLGTDQDSSGSSDYASRTTGYDRYN
ncbi:hypothetical protein N7478_006998 [Penicillium angulare]|uniref:uncharacterized protein n=1 Tax=Penicillium angulare TaxID=116970 RepID=UPI00254044FA|nr:uncharacterized protein N7478_006998 [Penicillium angulare]KAJ5281626.1 hypothetical protein N7478_006998 [Penicillium angulare]